MNLMSLADTRTLAAELDTVTLPLFPAGTGSVSVALPPAPEAALTANERDAPFGPTAAETVVGRQAPAAVNVTVTEAVPAGIVPIDSTLLPPDGTTAPPTEETTSAEILTLAPVLVSTRVPGLPAGTGRVTVVMVPVPLDALTMKVFFAPLPIAAVTTVSRQAPAPVSLTVTEVAFEARPARAIEADLPDGTTFVVTAADAMAEVIGAAEAEATPRPVNPIAPMAIAEKRTEPREVRNDLLVSGVVE